MKTTLWVLIGVAYHLAAQEATPDVTRVLEVVRGHVARLETSVPNFICNEQIVSRMYQNNKVKKETRAESVLTTTRSVKDGRGFFAEARAEMHINGKPSKRDHISDPFVWLGGPAYSDLHYLFNSSHGLECRSYQLVGHVQLDSKDVLLMQTRAAAGQADTCRDMPEDSADKIWLDPQSLNVVRIESFNPPTIGDSGRLQGSTLTLTADYTPVVFDDAEYWLPSHFISRLDFPGTPKYFVYEASFTGYHKYGAQSVIHIDPDN